MMVTVPAPANFQPNQQLAISSLRINGNLPAPKHTPAAVVAAMVRHTKDAELQRWGCGALHNLAVGNAACKQSIVDGGGVAVVVAAMGQHTADAELQ